MKEEKNSKSESIQRKFVESYDLSDYEILTDDGWKDAVSLHKTVPYEAWKLVTEKHDLICADDHIVFNDQMEEVFVKDIQPDSFVMTEDGPEKVLSVQKLDFSDNMYDIELADDSNHRYYTNGILSHNTTTYTVYSLWLATLFSDKKILICANKLATALEIMDRIRKAAILLPKDITPGVVSYNKGDITFDNGSSIKACSTSSSGARGTSANTLILDEFSFVAENLCEEFFASVIPIVSSVKNSKIIIVSTPNGSSGKYYELWQQANTNNAAENKDGWQPFRIRWWEVPGRDEEWKEQQIASIGMEKWKQEFECDFLTTSTKRLIPEDVIDKYRQKLAEAKLTGEAKGKKCKLMSENEDKIYSYVMWREFDQTRTYAASADIAEGVGGDSSVLYVWDITDLKNITMCTMFESNTVSVIEFAYVINNILALYGNPYLIAERNGCSSGTLDALKITYNYPRLVLEGKNNDAGVFSHVTVKGKACLWMREMLTTSSFGFNFYDGQLLEEFSSFVKKDTKGVHVVYQALSPAHDDHIAALMWLCWMLQNDIIEKYYMVVKTETSQLGTTYAQILQPLNEYTGEELKRISDDPVYQEFLEFKEEGMKLLKEAKAKEVAEDKQGFFRQTFDPYFGGYDNEPSWHNMSQSNEFYSQILSRNNIQPSFFINIGGGYL